MLTKCTKNKYFKKIVHASTSTNLRCFVKTGSETKAGFSLINRMIFEIQILLVVIVKLIIFNSNAKQEEV